MPKNKNIKMLSNEEALREGIERALWKIEFGSNYFHKTVKYDINKVAFFDHREAATVAALLIDISAVADKPDDVKKKFYLSELKKFEEAFVLSKDPNVKIRFMESLCGALATHTNIDWDNPAEIDYIVCSLKAQQTPGTTVEREPFEIFSAYTDKANVQRLEGISIKNLIHLQRFANMLCAQHPDLGKKLNVVDSEYPGYRLRMDITGIIQDGIDNGTNVISIDPTASGIMKDIFLDNTFDIVTEKPNPFNSEEMEVTHYTKDNAMHDFTEAFYEVSKNCINEQLVMRGYAEEGETSDLLFINGKSMTEIISEKKKELGNSYDALNAARASFRNALRDGNSVVSLMRANILEGGKIAFTHQEIKVDLDKLNKLERKEKHNAFRRALDFLKIYRIKPKYPSNAQRDANQDKIKATAEYKKWQKDAEKHFINTYNKASEKRRAEEDELARKRNGEVQRNKMFQAFPVVSNVENENELENFNQPINDNTAKERITSIAKDLDNNKNMDSSEPIIHEEPDRSKKIDKNI